MTTSLSLGQRAKAFLRATHDYDYRLRVLQIEDINLGGYMDPGDVAAWLAAPEDVNFDEVVDAADLAAVLEALASEE